MALSNARKLSHLAHCGLFRVWTAAQASWRRPQWFSRASGFSLNSFMWDRICSGVTLPVNDKKTSLNIKKLKNTRKELKEELPTRGYSRPANSTGFIYACGPLQLCLWPVCLSHKLLFCSCL